MDKSQYMVSNYKIIGDKFRDEKKLEQAIEFYSKAYNYRDGSHDFELLLNMGLRNSIPKITYIYVIQLNNRHVLDAYYH